MKKFAARPLTLALSLALLTIPVSKSAFASSTPTTPPTVTGSDPEPQGGIVKTILSILHLS